MLAPASPLVPYTLSAPLLPDRSGIPRTIDVEFGLLLKMFLLIGNDGDSAIAVVVLVLLDMLILLLLLLKLAAPVLVLDTIDLVAGDDDDQAAVELEVLGKE